MHHLTPPTMISHNPLLPGVRVVLQWAAAGALGEAMSYFEPQVAVRGVGMFVGLAGHCLMILQHPQGSDTSMQLHRLHVGCLVLAALCRVQCQLAAAGAALFLAGWSFVCAQDGLIEGVRQARMSGYPSVVLL
jgi:hypothetical protein